MQENSLKTKKSLIEEIKRIYHIRQKEIEKRLNEFKEIWNAGTDEDIFSELIFCILTPQSKALTCSYAVERICQDKLFLKGNSKQIANGLYDIRFKNRKAMFIVEARNCFTKDGKISIKSKIEKFRNARTAREWLVQNIKGFGYKEASHFLRNIGRGEELAILDRHILKNLESLGIIKENPKNLQRKKYYEIENSIIEFTRRIEIPLDHLDLLLWCKETGRVFK
ncbi:MAG: N-glycosylase/DNA lyase [Candidatus Bathyarchaeota archaeon]|nr:N-glycosylase/DNA lyase [Candidatus Bathyarchaeota archaeon]